MAEKIREETSAYWVDRLTAAGVPSGPINTLDAVFADPQVQHRGLQLKVTHGAGSDIPLLKSPLNLSASPVEYRAPPLLGEGTDDVLKGLLHLSPDEIAELRAQAVI
jgi:crotonobetainyl-CoA:carnitine CoA-transferase CaiB-like acyl-CoA transferase